MNLLSCFLIFGLLTGLAQPGWALGAGKNVITLTADQVDSADDIEAAIIKVTAQGTRPGTVILNGRKGAFVFTGDDKSLNLFVSDLTIRGENQAVIQNCDDGLFFDDFPLHTISVEGIAFLCTGDGVEASGAFQDVTLRNNMFRVGNNGVGTNGSSSGWLVSGNLIQAGGDGIRMAGADKVVITSNHLSGNIGIALLGCSQSQVRRNSIQAATQGVLLGQEAWKNMVQANTILRVSAAGIALEPGVTGNRVLANRVLCAARAECLTVDAAPETAAMNTIAGNRP